MNNKGRPPICQQNSLIVDDYVTFGLTKKHRLQAVTGEGDACEMPSGGSLHSQVLY